MDRKKKRKVVKWVALSVAMVLVAAICAGLWVWSVWNSTYRGSDARFFIPEGASEQAIADTLAAHLGKDFSDDVMCLWRWQKAEAGNAAGWYDVPSGTKAITLSRTLRYGRQAPVRVTFNNVRTMLQLAEKVSGYMRFSADDFLAACDSVLPAAGFAQEQYPAAFLPDTYEFYWNAPAEKVVRKMLEHRNAFWTDGRRAKAAALGLSPVDVATVASIVEEETGKADERPVVARLYINRLDRGMKLQADPTVKFAVGDFSLKRIYQKHLQVESPYNTYLHEGLPPGPIRVAESATLDQVLDAPCHDYLYMCAKEDLSGYHNFTRDYAEHQRNARRYRQAIDRMGVK